MSFHYKRLEPKNFDATNVVIVVRIPYIYTSLRCYDVDSRTNESEIYVQEYISILYE